jgi:hypothetical protein
MNLLRFPTLMTATTLAWCLTASIITGGDTRADGPSSTVGQQAANPADAIVGDWRPADMDVAIRIFPANGAYVGGVVKAANPALVNTELLRNVHFDPASSTWKGEVFAVKRGEFVPMTMRMTATGFEMVAGAGFLSKTVEWVRVQPGGN